MKAEAKAGAKAGAKADAKAEVKADAKAEPKSGAKAEDKAEDKAIEAREASGRMAGTECADDKEDKEDKEDEGNRLTLEEDDFLLRKKLGVRLPGSKEPHELREIPEETSPRTSPEVSPRSTDRSGHSLVEPVQEVSRGSRPSAVPECRGKPWEVQVQKTQQIFSDFFHFAEPPSCAPCKS